MKKTGQISFSQLKMFFRQFKLKAGFGLAVYENFNLFQVNRDAFFRQVIACSECFIRIHIILVVSF